jgi:polyhydroxybutyrate depolymerase
MLKKLLLLLCITGTLRSGAQVITDSILVDGHYRVFHFNKPAKPGGYLVFALHGSGGNGLQMLKASGKFTGEPHDGNVTVVCPDGYKHYWNECRKAATSPPNLENINEGAFFSKMIAYFKSRYQTNDRNAFAIGFSGGGHMAYKLALTMPNRFKAVTAVVANLPTQANMDCGESKRPVAVMIINGTADDTNPWNGGEMKVGAITLGKVRSTEQTFNYWADVDGYKGKPVKEMISNTNPNDKVTIEKYTYADAHKPEVTLLKVINGTHEFPPGPGLEVFTLSWEFFKRNMNN